MADTASPEHHRTAPAHRAHRIALVVCCAAVFTLAGCATRNEATVVPASTQPATTQPASTQPASSEVTVDMNLSEARRAAIELVVSVTEGLGIRDASVSKFAEAGLKDPTAYSCDQPEGYKRAETVIWSAGSLAFVPATDTLMRETASSLDGVVRDFHEAPGLNGTKRWVYSVEFSGGFQVLVTMNVQGTSFSVLTPCVRKY